MTRTKPRELTKPTVHLNGTARQALLDGYFDALSLVMDAISAVQETAPHGRDYYTQPEDALQHATVEHLARVARLETVRDELQALAEHVA